MTKIKVNDININYEIHGEGFPFLIINGFSSNIDWYSKDLIDYFSDYFKIIIFDNRGTGRTDNPSTEVSIKMMAEDAVGLMDTLKIEKFHLCGISMGGMIAQELILNYPEKVDKLVLCSTTCGFFNRGVPPSQKIIDLISNRTEDTKPEFIAKAAISILFTRDFIKNNREFIKMFIKQMLIVPTSHATFERQIEAIKKFDTFDRLKNIKAPTLVLHGKRDIFVYPKNSEILAEAISGAQLKLFDNAAHILFQPEPEKVLGTITDFLNS